MISINLDFDIIKAGTSLLSNIKKVVTSVDVSIKHLGQSNLTTVDRVVEDYFTGQTEPGVVVSVEGFLSKYVLAHRTAFYTLYSHRVTNHKTQPNIKNPLENKVSLEIGAQPNQLPIQAIPPIKHNQEIIYVYFLYPPDIQSFILPEDPKQIIKKDQKINIETILEIGREIKPVIIISPKKIHTEMGKIVRLTGVIKEADDVVVKQFTNTMSSTQQQVLSNTVRPFAEHIGSLCLDLRDSAKLEVKASPKRLNAILYTESHIENLTKIPNYKQVVSSAIPGAFPGLHWVAHQNENPAAEVSWGLSTSEVFIASVEFSRFALFIETDLCNARTYQDSLQKLHGFSELFRKSVQNYARKFHGVELKNKYDFMFDYSKAKLFHPDGVLVSKEVENILKQYPEVKSDVDWLRKS